LDVAVLEKSTRKRILSVGEGAAGQVWRSGKPIWSTDITKDMSIPRSLHAHAAGFSAGMWFAVKTQITVYGVVECLRTRLPRADQETLQDLERLGRLIGNEVERRGAELET